MRLTQSELDLIRERCERATPGPWRTATNRDRGPWADEDTEVITTDIFPLFSRNWKDACLNAVFVAKSRTDVPNLLAHIEFLEKALGQAVKEYSIEIQDVIPGRAPELTAYLEVADAS